MSRRMSKRRHRGIQASVIEKPIYKRRTTPVSSRKWCNSDASFREIGASITHQNNMLTYAALKFSCDPRNVYVIRASEHLYYNKRFFVGTLMGKARWSCRQGCRCGVDADDDFRDAEVLLMGNSRKIIINIVKQHHPDLKVIESAKKTEKSNEAQEKKRKRDDLQQLKSPQECKKVIKQDYEEVIIAANVGVLSSKVQYSSFQDHNDNSITDRRSVVNA